MGSISRAPREFRWRSSCGGHWLTLMTRTRFWPPSNSRRSPSNTRILIGHQLYEGDRIAKYLAVWVRWRETNCKSNVSFMSKCKWKVFVQWEDGIKFLTRSLCYWSPSIAKVPDVTLKASCTLSVVAKPSKNTVFWPPTHVTDRQALLITSQAISSFKH